MNETELVDRLAQEVERIGVKPVLALLVDWIGRGFFLEVFAQIQDEYPEERRTATNAVTLRS